MFDDHLKTAAVSLCVGVGASLFFVFSLAYTWEFWRQVKWYIIVMTVGNILSLYKMSLTTAILGQYWSISTDEAYKFVEFISSLGLSVTNMSIAALAVHVFLTSVTGCQGNTLRHGLVISVFVHLSLTLTLYQIPTHSLQHKFLCTNGFEDEEHRVYHIGVSVTAVFFPLALVICACVASLLLKKTSNRKTVISDVDNVDFFLTTFLGLLVAAYNIPFNVAYLGIHDRNNDITPVYCRLYFLTYSVPAVTSLACATFGYALMFVHCHQGFMPPFRQQNNTGKHKKRVN